MLLGISSQAFSQLKLYKEYGVEIVGSLESFLEKNDFEYAIASQPTSPWYSNRNYSCLVKQRDTWYLLKVVTTPGSYPSTGPLRVRPTIRQRQLTPAMADSMLAIILPEQGMKYSQVELNCLPLPCEIIYRGKKGFLFGPGADGTTYHLAEKKNEEVSSISFYEPEVYLKTCMPLNPKSQILAGMVNTFQKLDSLTSSLNK